MKTILVLPLASLIVASSLAWTQSSQGLPVNDPLYKTVAGLDTELFDAYNNCQIDKLGSLVAEDLEFYHDKSPASTIQDARWLHRLRSSSHIYFDSAWAYRGRRAGGISISE